MEPFIAYYERDTSTSRQNVTRCGSRRKTSRFKGVTWHVGKWQASIQTDGRSLYLGRHESEEDAAHAYDEKAREIFGQLAFTNFSM
jgi:hypothetical protein